MEALLQVKGFGEQKALKYGSEILALISEWYTAQSRNASKRKKAQKTPQPPLRLRPDQLARYAVDPAGISMTEFARRLTALKDENQHGELTGRQLSDRLLAEGYLSESVAETGRPRRSAAPAGEGVGIRMETRSRENGESFTMVTLTEQAQQWLIDRFSNGDPI